MSEGLVLRMFEERLRPLGCSAWRRDASGRTYCCLQLVTCWEGAVKIDPDSSLTCPLEGREAAGQWLQHGEF